MLPPSRREKYVANLRTALDRGSPGRSEIERAPAEEPAATSLRE